MLFLGGAWRQCSAANRKLVFGLNTIAIYSLSQSDNGFSTVSGTFCIVPLLLVTMVFQHISQDIKEHVVWLRAHSYITDDICDMFGVSLRSIHKSAALHEVVEAQGWSLLLNWTCGYSHTIQAHC
jgi:hypothetical protein